MKTGSRERGVVRIGVIGCASIAERRMLPSMARQPLVELVAVASRQAAKAESFAARFGAQAVTGYDRLLERDDIDAVYIPLPPQLHLEWTIKALRCGKHVLCEKPFSANRDEAVEATRAAREHGLLLMESFMFLYHSQHATVRQLIADGAIGDVRMFTSEFGIPMVAGDNGNPPRHASTLPEVAAYPIRAAQLFLGPDLEVAGTQLRVDPVGGQPVAGAALLCSPAGVGAQLSYGLEHGYQSDYALWGTEGRMSLRRAFSTPDNHAPVVRIERQNTVEDRTLPSDIQFTNIAGAFAEKILQGKDFTTEAEAIVRQASLMHNLLRSS